MGTIGFYLKAGVSPKSGKHVASTKTVEALEEKVQMLRSYCVSFS